MQVFKSLKYISHEMPVAWVIKNYGWNVKHQLKLFLTFCFLHVHKFSNDFFIKFCFRLNTISKFPAIFGKPVMCVGWHLPFLNNCFFFIKYVSWHVFFFFIHFVSAQYFHFLFYEEYQFLLSAPLSSFHFKSLFSCRPISRVAFSLVNI